MKANHTVSSAKSIIQRNRGKFEGKQIIISPPSPGIKMLGAIDFLLLKGYGYQNTLLAQEKLTFAQAVKKATEAIDKFIKVAGGIND